ncbi:unnamed protein product, partial [Musa acuminata subsp. malaccensis]
LKVREKPATQLASLLVSLYMIDADCIKNIKLSSREWFLFVENLHQVGSITLYQ